VNAHFSFIFVMFRDPLLRSPARSSACLSPVFTSAFTSAFTSNSTRELTSDQWRAFQIVCRTSLFLYDLVCFCNFIQFFSGPRHSRNISAGPEARGLPAQSLIYTPKWARLYPHTSNQEPRIQESKNRESNNPRIPPRSKPAERMSWR